MSTPDAQTYTFDQVDAAMCIIEEIVDPNLATTPWQDFRDACGIAHLREIVLTRLAWPCHEAWMRANERFETAYAEWAKKRQEANIPALGHRQVEDARAWDKANPSPQEPGAFDYEFVPFWLRECVDWSVDVTSVDAAPRVRGRKS